MKATEGELLWLSRALEEEYGRGSAYPEDPPLSGEPDSALGTLVVTMLSQASNDAGTRKVYRAMRERFPTWESVATAPHSDLVDVLRSGGLAEGKAQNIQATLKRIRSDFGDYSLRALRSWDDQEVYDYLTGLPGVGPKTAACVLLFALGREAFPVDTHVARISRRLGLVPKNYDPARIQAHLEPLIPRGHSLPLHLNLLEHGRKTCHARKPNCTACILSERCDRIRNNEYSADGN
ncbi:MAG: endonuclease III domain-containing protein [Bacillota bacterium]